jgi:rhodanese-related sulfurtransferase
MASDMGYSNVFVYREGMLGWVKAGHQVDSVVDYPKVKIPRISSIELKKINTSSTLLLDIRPLSHFLKGQIQDSTNIDLEKLHRKLGMLPKDKKIVLIDHK